MEFRNLKTFLQVVESGSFTKAAEVLGYTQSTVSFQMNQLEEELGCKLFDRINHTICLTEKGKLLQQHALSITHSVSNLTQSFLEPEKIIGQVRIASSDSICEKMMLLNYQNFYNTYPEVELVFINAITQDLINMLDHNEVDVIFTLDSHVYRNDYVIAKESPVKLNFVVGPDFPLANTPHIKMEQLLEYPFLLTEKGMSYRKILDDKLAEFNLEIHPVLEAARTDILATVVENGQAITFLPDFVTEQKVREGKLKYLDMEDVNLTIWKQLIYRKDKWMSQTLRHFLDFVMDHEFEW